jgi:hypothetical protein
VAVALHVAADHGSVEDSLRRVAIFHEGLKPIHVGCTDREGHPVRIALTRTSPNPAGIPNRIRMSDLIR